eukprot:SAG25_NODE_1000_length_4352_cov_31.202680_9_plen_244_part_00
MARAMPRAGRQRRLAARSAVRTRCHPPPSPHSTLTPALLAETHSGDGCARRVTGDCCALIRTEDEMNRNVGESQSLLRFLSMWLWCWLHLTTPPRRVPPPQRVWRAPTPATPCVGGSGWRGRARNSRRQPISRARAGRVRQMPHPLHPLHPRPISRAAARARDDACCGLLWPLAPPLHHQPKHWGRRTENSAAWLRDCLLVSIVNPQCCLAPPDTPRCGAWCSCRPQWSTVCAPRSELPTFGS